MIQRYVKRRIQSDWGNLALLSDVGDLPLTINKLLFYFCTSWGDWVRYVHVDPFTISIVYNIITTMSIGSFAILYKKMWYNIKVSNDLYFRKGVAMI